MTSSSFWCVNGGKSHHDQKYSRLIPSASKHRQGQMHNLLEWRINRSLEPLLYKKKNKKESIKVLPFSHVLSLTCSIFYLLFSVFLNKKKYLLEFYTSCLQCAIMIWNANMNVQLVWGNTEITQSTFHYSYVHMHFILSEQWKCCPSSNVFISYLDSCTFYQHFHLSMLPTT